MTLPIDYQPLLDELGNSTLSDWACTLPETIAYQLRTERWGDLPAWRAVLEQLPPIAADSLELKKAVSIGSKKQLSNTEYQQLRNTLMGLHPWRKGPYQLFGMDINTEWRSDWKWDRVLPHISPLHNRLVLDVGCGNGYHCWRMAGEGARRVIGIDPSAKFVFQFYALKHFAGKQLPVDVLPLGIEHMPPTMRAFDTVFSMGVLYHRRSPMDHLRELRDLLRPGGQLVLETLVIEGDQGQVLVPEGRYAKMPNVWFLPSTATLLSWMRKNSFKNPRVVDVAPTSIEEQRATEWMTFESLQDFLDPDDPSRTVEGHPAPVRAVIVAEAP